MPGVTKMIKFKYYSLFLNNHSLLLKMIAKNTSKIVLFLLKNHNKFGYNINQIARKLNISIGSAFKILNDLEKKDIVLSRKINNAKNFKLNFFNEYTIKLCELLLLEEKIGLRSEAKIYASEIEKFENSRIIILFGSVLHSTQFNDVDVLFVTNSVKKTNNFCLEVSQLRSKPVVPLIINKYDLINEIKKSRDSILEIVRKGVIVRGESEFVELMKSVNS
jgi:predicted transcriptional regulator